MGKRSHAGGDTGRERKKRKKKHKKEHKHKSKDSKKREHRKKKSRKHRRGSSGSDLDTTSSSASSSCDREEVEEWKRVWQSGADGKNASTAVSFGGCPPLVASSFLSRSSLMRFHVAGSTHSLSVGTYHGLDRRYAATSLLNFFKWLQYQCASAVVPVLFSFLSIFGLLPELLVGWYMNPDMFMD